MTEDTTPPPIITALPDVGASPTDPKKQKVLHVDGSAADDTSDSSGSRSSTPGISQSKSLGRSPMKVDETDGTTSPVVMAVPLPTDEGLDEKEEWWELRMTWSGKVYNMTVGSNDM